MQVAVGAGEDHLVGDDAAQRRGDRWRRCVPHAGIANERDVGPQHLGVLRKESGQRRRAGLLLAFEQDRNRARRAAELLECPARFQERHQLAFVVRSAARHDPLAARPRFELRLERRRSPEIERVCGLDVVMAVEQHVRRIPAGRLDVADDHRASGGRMFGRLETDRAEFGDQPVGRPFAVGEMGGRGGNRRNLEKVEQPLEGRPPSASIAASVRRSSSWPSAPFRLADATPRLSRLDRGLPSRGRARA